MVVICTKVGPFVVICTACVRDDGGLVRGNGWDKDWPGSFTNCALISQDIGYKRKLSQLRGNGNTGGLIVYFYLNQYISMIFRDLRISRLGCIDAALWHNSCFISGEHDFLPAIQEVDG